MTAFAVATAGSAYQSDQQQGQAPPQIATTQAPPTTQQPAQPPQQPPKRYLSTGAGMSLTPLPTYTHTHHIPPTYPQTIPHYWCRYVSNQPMVAIA